MTPAKRKMCLMAVLVPGLAITTAANRVRNPLERLPRNGTVFIDPIDGFGPQVEKAFLKENVPWVIVSSRDDADFEITGAIRDVIDTEIGTAVNLSTRDAEQSNRLVMLSIVNVRTKNVVWGYGVAGAGDMTNAAESFAKTVKAQIRHKRRR